MLSDTINRLRTERGMSCQELADMVGTTKMAIEKYEANIWRPGTQTLAKIAKGLNVSVDELMGDCSLVKNGDSYEISIVRQIGDKQVRLVGTLKVECENVK